MNIKCLNRGQRSEIRGEGSGFRGEGSGCRVQGAEHSMANCKLQIANCKLPTRNSGQWAVGGGQGSKLSTFHSPLSTNSSFILHSSLLSKGTVPFSLRENRDSPPSAFHLRPLRGFTLIELLVTIAIIAILAGITLAGLRWARTMAAEAKTKATITKLNAIIMKQYESYMTRRVPVDMSGFPPKVAAIYRLLILRDIMRMEMPERFHDIEKLPLDFFNLDVNVDDKNVNGKYIWGWPDGTILNKIFDPIGSNDYWDITLPNNQKLIIPRIHSQTKPAIFQLYQQKYLANNGTKKYGPAKCLYTIISMAHPEDMEQFSQDEIGEVDGDGWLEFIDGWGMPIMLLRWAPGFSSGEGLNPNPFNPSHPTQQRVDVSDIQTGNPINDHDPYDTNNVDPKAFRLTPLIYSAGSDKKYGIEVSEYLLFNGDPYQFPTNGEQVGTPVAEDGIKNTHLDNIHNHHIEQK